ncbi:MAG TPA: peptide-methionine (R)-S-oxide reductase MsrB [Pirellulales bacterium]|jgi:peptide-methionine (R)-S-oxide reductase|nr:peptide-methionine (R)-S-oxide reductase MsrB [Pirellulales bacterium]
MLLRSVSNSAMCTLVAALAVSTVVGLQMANGAAKAGGKAKGDGAPKESKAPKGIAEGTDSGATAKEGGAKGEPAKATSADEDSDGDLKPVHKTDREWRRLLSAKEYRVTRQKETELPFSGKYVHTKKEGVYRCVCCGAKLFGSDTKFDSGTGWPSFYAPMSEKGIATAADYTDGTPRVEVTCSRCDAHLGHVFGDGPDPTGLRFCINSVALKLEESPKQGATSGNKPETKSVPKPGGKKPNGDK